MNIFVGGKVRTGCSLKLLLIIGFISLLELSILVYVGTLIGVVYTLGIVLATAVVGILVARHQGLAIISRVQESMSQGIIPSVELFNGVLILLGCLLLILPGLIADLLGILLLIPHTRRIIGKWVFIFIMRRAVKAQMNHWKSK